MAYLPLPRSIKVAEACHASLAAAVALEPAIRSQRYFFQAMPNPYFQSFF